MDAIRTIVALAVTGFFIATLHAQVPQLVNYQGRVAVGGVNFNGTGQFKFALVNTAGNVTYWSNDGTSGGGSQPAGPVALPVTNGLYSVLLGDPTPTNNMTAIPSSVFANADVRLRVWFNDGTHGFQLLTPDQRLTAVGYAVIAGGVNLPATTSSTAGVIAQAGSPLIHTFGTNNFFAGLGAGNFSMTGGSNTATGQNALPHDTSGSNNTASGYQALAGVTTGGNNIGLGTNAGSNFTTSESNNIDIGNLGVAGESNIIRLGTNGTQTDTFLTGIIHGNGSGLTGISATYTDAGSGASPISVSSYLAANEATPEMFGGSSASGFDNASALAAARDAGKSIVIPSGTYEVHSALNFPKYNGQYIRGINARNSILKFTTDTNGINIVAASVGDPFFGAGVFGVSIKHLTILGPGTYNSTANAFSGSTGDGVHMDNGGSHYGDYEHFEDLYINRFNRCVYINDIGNASFIHCAFEYAGSGLVIGAQGTNGIQSVKLTTSNCAANNISVAGGDGIVLGLGDCTVNPSGSTNQIAQSGGVVTYLGGNFESCSASGHVANISAGMATFVGSYITRGGGADNTALVSSGSAALVLNTSAVGGYTTPYSGNKVKEIGAAYDKTSAPPSGGGYWFLGTSGGYNFSLDWERYMQGDFSLNYASALGTPTNNILYVDAAHNYTTVGHATNTQPTGAQTLNVEGSVGISSFLSLTPGSAPGSPTEGMVYVNHTDHHIYEYNGSTWKQLDN